MSTRTNLRPQIVIPSPQGTPANSGDMSSNITSAPTVLQSLSRVSYSCSWVGTAPVGTISVQVSNDYSIGPNGVVANAGTWNTVTLLYNGVLVMSVPISGNSGNGFVEVNETAAYAIRLVYTATSGTGTLTATVVGKVS